MAVNHKAVGSSPTWGVVRIGGAADCALAPFPWVLPLPPRLPLETAIEIKNAHRENSFNGRTLVSKTKGTGFKSLFSCRQCPRIHGGADCVRPLLPPPLEGWPNTLANLSWKPPHTSMLYILNSSLKDNKKCSHSLSGFYGLGCALCQQICDLLGFSRNIKINQLTGDQRARLSECVAQNYQINALLRADLKRYKARLVTISSYRGFRLSRGLPCRGQRTHGNSRTCRKPNRV